MALVTTDVKSLDPNNYTGPARITANGPVRMREVTPGTPFGEYASWLYVGTAGNVSIIEWDGTTIILNNLQAGRWHFIPCIQVNSGDTTALNIRWGS